MTIPATLFFALLTTFLPAEPVFAQASESAQNVPIILSELSDADSIEFTINIRKQAQLYFDTAEEQIRPILLIRNNDALHSSGYIPANFKTVGPYITNQGFMLKTLSGKISVLGIRTALLDAALNFEKANINIFKEGFAIGLYIFDTNSGVALEIFLSDFNNSIMQARLKQKSFKTITIPYYQNSGRTLSGGFSHGSTYYNPDILELTADIHANLKVIRSFSH